MGDQQLPGRAKTADIIKARLARTPPAQPAAPTPDRRKVCRQRCDGFAEYRSLSGRTDINRPAHVCNLSTVGCALVVATPHSEGTLLIVKLFDKAGKARAARPAVVRHLQRPAEGGWLLGLKFVSPLTLAEMDAVL
jgi:hypothetical protein